MAPKQTNNSANVPSDEKASVWLADALRLTGDEITLNIAAIAAARGQKVTAVTKQVSRLREKLPGIKIKTTSQGAAMKGASKGARAGGGGRGGGAKEKAEEEEEESEEEAEAGASPADNEKKRGREEDEDESPAKKAKA